MRKKGFNMREDHFKAQLIPNGYSCTLPTRLGELLYEAETKYGPRDKNYTLLGIEFGPGTNQIWYPGDRGYIAIQLAMNALDDLQFSIYQLAHECIHLLAPSGQSGALVIEEGLATVFSEDVVYRLFQVTGMTTGAPAYVSAAAQVRELLMVNPDAVKLLRNQEPSFNKLTQNHFTQLFPTIDLVLVDNLLKPFRKLPQK